MLQQAKSSSRANGTAAAEAGPPEELAPFAGCGTQDVQCLQANRPSCPARAYQGYDGFTCPAGQYCAKASPGCGQACWCKRIICMLAAFMMDLHLRLTNLLAVYRKPSTTSNAHQVRSLFA